MIVDDNSDYARGVTDNLALYGYEGIAASTPEEAELLAREHHPEIFFIDLCLGDNSGIELLKKLRSIRPTGSFFMITGYGTIETAIRSLKIGARDYLQKPISFETILQAISEAHPLHDSVSPNDLFASTAVSLQMNNLLHQVERLVYTDLPILIVGESGTGKELLADHIVQQSPMVGAPFVKVNSCAFSDSLLDNELFGHEKGAYTGATSTFRGVFERAHGGTLFLDEIGDMPLSIQAKVLRALQNKEIRRLGSEKTIHVDSRIIAATNKNLDAMIATGEFRRDLYYRLNTAEIKIPPLRERVEDIPTIAEAVLSTALTSSTTPAKHLSSAVMDFLLSYSWPGNVRELRNALLYASAMSGDSPVIQISDLPANMAATTPTQDHAVGSLEFSERQTILHALRATSFNKSKTAALLAISRSTLYQKIEKYGIGVNES